MQNQNDQNDQNQDPKRFLGYQNLRQIIRSEGMAGQLGTERAVARRNLIRTDKPGRYICNKK